MSMITQDNSAPENVSFVFKEARVNLSNFEQIVKIQTDHNSRYIKEKKFLKHNENSTIDVNVPVLEPLFHTNRKSFIVTAHWGNYFEAFINMTDSFPEDSEFLTVRGRDWNGINEDELWVSVNGRSNRKINVFRKNASGLKITRLLKEGSHALILYDLDASYGRPLSTSIFGNRIILGAG